MRVTATTSSTCSWRRRTASFTSNVPRRRWPWSTRRSSSSVRHDPVQTLSACALRRGAVLTSLGRVASARGVLPGGRTSGPRPLPRPDAAGGGALRAGRGCRHGAHRQRGDPPMGSRRCPLPRRGRGPRVSTAPPSSSPCAPRRATGWARRCSTEPSPRGSGTRARGHAQATEGRLSRQPHVRRRRASAVVGVTGRQRCSTGQGAPASILLDAVPPPPRTR